MRWALALVLALALPAAAQPAPAGRSALALLEQISIDLRARLLDSGERTAIRAAIARGVPADELRERYLRRWLTPGAYKQVWNAFGGAGRGAEANLFLDRMARVKRGARWVYFLPSAGGEPCADQDLVPVHPWWAVGEEIAVCKQSYRPATAFDKVGYCGGKPGMIPAPPRPDCGCGPLLLACLPPEGAAPAADEAIAGGIVDEIERTIDDVIASDRPYDELYTTSRTWQNGGARFLYLRRELVGLMRKQPYSDALNQELISRVAAIDLLAPGAWVERQGPYRGSGLYLATPYVLTQFGTYRDLIRALYADSLCVVFSSVHVDSDVLLKAVGGQHANLRALNSWDSPMRHQVGCQGCHRPMDEGTAFLSGMTTPIFGAHPTGLRQPASFYLKGATDLRGSGEGMEGLGRFIVSQPEFAQCAAKTAFNNLLHRQPFDSELPLVDDLTKGFEAHHHSWRWLVDAVLHSPPYLGRAH
jgi:hypothetical protein